MVESLRGLGYSTATALADIIDNSVAAAASSVAIQFTWAGSGSWVSVLDDGNGMSDVELEHAMRLGDRSPAEERSSSDLGRFGLGLKTASFSQCRSLTVASVKDGARSCLRWDLDVLAASADQGWHLLEGGNPGSEPALDKLPGHRNGTLVLWERMDRIVTPGSTEQDFLDLMDVVERHLAMVFHRYLEGPRPRLTITLNGRRIGPWDPFLRDHPATWSSPVERLHTAAGTVEVQCHVLPHKDRLDTATHGIAAGPEGWTAQQGFYVYRNTRLLVAGSWLGLGQGRAWTKEEAHRLARIRVDIPNTADDDWKIDIRKSTARPPVAVKSRLVTLAEVTREKARRVFAHRGQVVVSGRAEQVTTAWRAEHTKGGMRYRIDESHPAVRGVLDDAGALEPAIRAMLRIIEETIPVQRIWLDTTEAKETPRTGFATDPPAEVTSVLSVLFRNLVRKGMPPDRAKDQLKRTDPFHAYPDLVDALDAA
ncbi:MAG: hypothetical protein RLY86_2566 [Pseudomonadota bacterium]